MSDEPVLQIATDGATRILTLHRPQVYNALNAALKKELLAALRDAARDSAVRAVLLTGAGQGFCSGQDLREPAFAHLEHVDLADEIRRTYNSIVTTIRTMEKPVIAAINGVAAGAGCALALACDLRVASEEASLVMAFVRIGLIPDSGATYFLPQLVGYARAFEFAVLGESCSASDAERLGLVNRVVPAADLSSVALALAQRLAAAPTRAIGLTKRAFNRALSSDLATALEYEAALQSVAQRSDDHREGLAAFLAKRPATFTGQ